MAPLGTGGWGTTVFAASSIRPVTRKAIASRSAREPLPTSSRPVASASVETATNSTPPATEVTHPTASRTPESVLLARSSSRTSRGRNSPAPAATEQTKNAAVESSRISLLSPFTSLQVIKGDMKAPGPTARRSWICDVEEKSDSQRCQPTAHSITSVCNEVKPHCKPLLCYSIAQDAAVLPALQDTFRLPLQLPDPLARDVQLVAEFGEGGRLAVVETVAPDEHVARPLGKTFDGFLQMLRLHLTHHGIRRIRDLVVLDEVTQLRSGLLAGHRLIEARRVRHGAHRKTHPVGVPVQAPGYLFLGGLAFDLQGQPAHGPADLPDLLRHVHGYADGTALISHRALYGLTDPPRGVRREAEAPIRVELLHGLHQADVSLLDQVLEGKPVAPVLLGNADHQPEVLLDEPLPGPPVAGLGPHAEIYLLPVRQQVALPYVREILGEELGGLRFTLDLLIVLTLFEIGFQNALLTTHPSYRKSVLETTISFTTRFNFLNLSEG